MITISNLQCKVQEQNEIIRTLQQENLRLEEELEVARHPEIVAKDGGSYSVNVRLFTFDSIVNQLATANVPKLMEQYSKRVGEPFDEVHDRSIVEMMARELGAVSDLQTAEILLDALHGILGFDATTRDGSHVNSIHFTTEDKAVEAALDELAGGTQEDYANHVCDTVDHLAAT